METLKVIITRGGEISKEPEIFCGVYHLHIGDCFYCGRSVNIWVRAWQHEYNIRCLIYKVQDNPELIPADHYLRKVLSKMVSENIRDLHFEVMEECDRENILELEQKWLSKAEESGRSLNVGFIARPSSGDTRLINKIKRADAYLSNK